MRPTLKVYTPINRGRFFVADITQDAIGWRRSMRSMGGYWMGSFTLESKSKYYGGSGGASELMEKFYNWLGNEIVEESGGFQTWQGLIYSMDLTYKGLIRRRSLELMSNSVKVEYDDDEGDSQTTDAAEAAVSIGYFGRKEALITYDGIDATAAEAFRDRYLNENSWTYPRVVGVNPAVKMLERDESITTLEVNCCGYIFTGNWRFEQVGDGSIDNLSDWLTEIVTTDMEFVDVGVFQENTIQIYKTNSSPRRAWDVISGLVELGDTSGNPHYFMVGNNRLAYYGPINPVPKYYLREGKIYASPSGNTPADIWRMRPAVVRDMDYPVTRYWYGGWLENIRDFYMDEYECSVETGLTIKSSLFDESEMLISLASYLKRNEPPEED